MQTANRADWRVPYGLDETSGKAVFYTCIALEKHMLILIKQAVRNQSMSFSLRDENGFTPEESVELVRRIREVRNNEAVRHDPFLKKDYKKIYVETVR